MKTRWPITLMCQVLEVSASGYLGWEASGRRPERPGVRCHNSEVLLAHIRSIHERLRGEYGWPRMHRELLSRGLRVGKERVRQLMQRHGIRNRQRSDTARQCWSRWAKWRTRSSSKTRRSRKPPSRSSAWQHRAKRCAWPICDIAPA